MLSVDELRAAIPQSMKGKGSVIRAKYESGCGWCGVAILPGDAVLWLPADKAVLCEACAQDGEEPAP